MGLLSSFVSAGGTNRFLITNGHAGTTQNTVSFWPIDSNSGSFASGTEALVDETMRFAFRITRHHCTAIVNTKNVNFTCLFRDDAGDVASVTLTASTTGEFDSGVLTDDIVIDSVCDMERDTSGSASGTTTFVSYLECTII